MGTDTISTPSFQSDWYEAIAKNKALANITIPHDLDQYPVKVDVQVKVQINGVDHYFTGSGSANRDDDLYYDFGECCFYFKFITCEGNAAFKSRTAIEKWCRQNNLFIII
jgi:hypothetical protein